MKDRLSFQQYLGLKLGDEVPDANTLWDFREFIEKDGQEGAARFFGVFHAVLEQGRFLAREGDMVDASLVEASKQHNSRNENNKIKAGKRPDGFNENTAKERQKDCEARCIQKNKTN